MGRYIPLGGSFDALLPIHTIKKYNEEKVPQLLSA